MRSAKPLSIVIVIFFLLTGLSVLPEFAGDDRYLVYEPQSGNIENTEPVFIDNVLEENGFESSTRGTRYVDTDMTVDDAQLHMWGANAVDYAGYSLAFGDIDNDGYDDLVIGAPYADGLEKTPRSGAGEVLIKFGRPGQTYPGTVHDFAKNKFDMIIYGAAGSTSGNDAGDTLGFAVTTGDINGDDYDDIIMGAPQAQMNNNQWWRRDAGGVFVVYGDERSKLPGVVDLLTDTDFVVWGSNFESQVGRAVASGDFNKDGFDDILIGEPMADPNSKTNAGLAWIVFGSNSLGANEDLLRQNRSPSTIPIVGARGTSGNDAGDQLGYSVAAGDVNNDEYDDVIVGAPTGQRGSLRVNAGATYIIYGSNSMNSIYDMATDASVNIWGSGPGDWSGIYLGTGNVDGDGSDDILIGAVFGDGESNNIQNCGEMYIKYGGVNLPQDIDLANEYDTVVWGRNADDYLGSNIATGNLNGDEYADFIVGAYANDAGSAGITDAGAVFVFHGGSRGDLGTKIDPKNDAVGQIYGVNASDYLGFRVAMGDFDGDGASDIAASSFTADGPLNARDACGEVYLVYGKAPPVTINSIEVLDKDGNPTEIVYSKYSEYTFRVNITNVLGTVDLAEVVLNLDPSGEDLRYKWTNAPNPFTEIKDTNSKTTLSSLAGDAVQKGLYFMELDFKLEFGWEFDSSGPLQAAVTAKGIRSLESTQTFPDLFQVEDDLEFYGTLEVYDDEAAVLKELSWVAGGENLLFTGLTTVYQGTSDVFPPVGQYQISIMDENEGLWTNSTVSGEQIAVDVFPKKINDPLDKFSISIDSPPSESGRAVKTINLSIDSELPQPPVNIVFKRNEFSTNSITAVNSTDFWVEWDEAEDKFSGIKGYYYSLENNEGTSMGTFTSQTGVKITDAPVGSNTIYIWSVDIAGNIGNSAFKNIFVDLEKSVFSKFEPDNTDWLRSRAFKCTIQIDDADGVGIDTTSLRYRLSTKGQSGYGIWYSVSTVEELGVNKLRASVEISGDLEEGDDNYIMFRASDLAGNEIRSSEYNLKLDISELLFQNELPASLEKQPDGNVVFGITITDEISGVDITSIQYKVSTTGKGRYGDWTNNDMYPIIDNTGALEGVRYRADLILGPGKENYIKWRAKDIAGNGYTESDDFQIWVNSAPVPVIDSPAESGKFKHEKSVTFSAVSTTDPDNETLRYSWRSSVNGELSSMKEFTTSKLSPGVHEITLEVSDDTTTVEVTTSIEIEIEQTVLGGTGVFGGTNAVDLAIILILLILTVLIFFLFLSSRKKLKKTEEEAKRVSAELIPPGRGIPGGFAMGSPPQGVSLQAGYGGAPHAGIPELPGTGQPPTYTADVYGTQSSVIQTGPGGGQPGGATGQVTPAVPQLPPAVSAEYPHLNNQQKLDLLEEKFLTGQISENLYMQLKDKYLRETQREMDQSYVPAPAPVGQVSQPYQSVPGQGPAPPSDDFTFKRPEVYPPGPGPTPQPIQPQPKPGPSNAAGSVWGAGEDALSRITIPGKDQTETSSSGRKLKKVKQ